VFSGPPYAREMMRDVDPGDGGLVGPLAPPNGRSWVRELAAVSQPVRLLWRAPVLRRQPRATGQPVLLLPGFRSGEAAMAPLRRYLHWLGYDARHWGLGRNDGDVEALVPQVVAEVDAVRRRTGEEVRLVGWSLGGVIAREVARDRPDLVSRVVTYGTPVVGGPKYTLAADAYPPTEVERIAAAVEEANRRPIAVPVTAIWTRHDGVVAWRACVDRGPGVRNVEVRSTHLGLGVDPDVWTVVAQSLAA
jgi:pimeloyl-ACP methyl ester carboxylesterase